MDPEDFIQDKEENNYSYDLRAMEELNLADDDSSTKEESSLNSDSTHSHREDRLSHRGGRPKHPETLLLKKFRTLNSNNRVKKETLRIYFYRGARICLTCMKRGKPMSRRINHLFQGSDSCRFRTYTSDLREYVFLLDSCLVEPKEIGEKSHNDHFFRRAFQETGMREFMRKYLEFVLFDTDTRVLSARLNITCCQEAEHGLECSEKWEELKKFCFGQLFSFD